MSWQDDVARFQEAISEHLGVQVDIDYRKIGGFQRFPTDKPADKSGWLVLYTAPIVAGAFGDWRTGESHAWSAVVRESMSSAERYQMRYLLQQAKNEAQRMRQEAQRKASDEAYEIWCRAGEPCEWHPYLMKKRVRPYMIRQLGDDLIIPMTDSQERVVSIQRITPDGTKLFHKGSRTKGLFHFIPGKDHTVGVAEGYATAATLYEDFGFTMFCAFNANNLIPVAAHARAMYPKAKLTIFGDDDRWTPNNPGRTKALEAANDALADDVLFPDFTGLDLSSRPTDFNDLRRLRDVAGL